jgi:hypothetical protein
MSKNNNMKIYLVLFCLFVSIINIGCTRKDKDKQRLKSPCVSLEGPCNWKPLNLNLRKSKV